MAASVDRYGRIIHENRENENDPDDETQTDWGNVLVAGLVGLAIGVIAVLLSDD